VQTILALIVFVIIFVMSIFGFAPTVALEGAQTPAQLVEEVRVLWE
jgi:hypothetical protein